MEKLGRLIVVTGPTGSGKSALAVELAMRLSTEIISADSRQIYKGLPIGTAAPTHEQLAAAPHHLVAFKELDQYYSAAQFEADAMALLPGIFARGGGNAVVCGGSMMYVDALVGGIDDLPAISPQTRDEAMELYRRGGLQRLRLTLLDLDPVYYRQVDLNNPKRLIHAIEICRQAGVPYSSLRTGKAKERPFDIVMMAIDWPREQLFKRINSRVDMMIADGLVDETRSVIAFRDLNSLNTVGYKEMLRHLDGEWDLATARDRMAKNTRVYAKKQLTWMKKRQEIARLDPQSPTPLIEQALNLLI